METKENLRNEYLSTMAERIISGKNYSYTEFLENKLIKLEVRIAFEQKEKEETAYCDCKNPEIVNDLEDGKSYCNKCGFDIKPKD